MEQSCITCQITLTKDNTYKRGGKDKRTLQSYCKKCWNHMCSQRWITRKIAAIEAMGGKCADCERTYIYQAMSFHHLDPRKKDFSWNELKKRSQEQINEELSKCVLLCLNCHAIRHVSLESTMTTTVSTKTEHGRISTYRAGCVCAECSVVAQSLTDRYKRSRILQAPKRTLGRSN